MSEHKILRLVEGANKDHPYPKSRWWHCRFSFAHRWGLWDYKWKGLVETSIYQTRRCLRCGYRQEKTI